jgi:hypothetical protein
MPKRKTVSKKQYDEYTLSKLDTENVNYVPRYYNLERIIQNLANLPRPEIESTRDELQAHFINAPELRRNRFERIITDYRRRNPIEIDIERPKKQQKITNYVERFNPAN